MDKPLTINLLPNGTLWEEFGILLERGQGNEFFFFDKNTGIGTGLMDNIGYLLCNPDRSCSLATTENVTAFSSDKLPIELDNFLMKYFFGPTIETE